MSGKRIVRWFSVVLLGSALVPRLAAGQTTNSAKAPAPANASKGQTQAPAPTPTEWRPSPKNYDEIYQQYLASARGTKAAGPLWMADLMGDRTARHMNDLVTIRVVESISATGSADSTVNKAGSGNIVLPSQPWVDMTLGRVVPFSSETKFNGSGGTTRNTELSATLTARVMDVLPNGDLVVQGVREVDVNNDRSLVVLSGVIRPNDVGPGNVILSSRVGQLQISALSQGLIKDSLTPGYLIRLINKVF